MARRRTLRPKLACGGFRPPMRSMLLTFHVPIAGWLQLKIGTTCPPPGGQLLPAAATYKAAGRFVSIQPARYFIGSQVWRKEAIPQADGSVPTWWPASLTFRSAYLKLSHALNGLLSGHSLTGRLSVAEWCCAVQKDRRNCGSFIQRLLSGACSKVSDLIDSQLITCGGQMNGRMMFSPLKVIRPDDLLLWMKQTLDLFPP